MIQAMACGPIFLQNFDSPSKQLNIQVMRGINENRQCLMVWDCLTIVGSQSSNFSKLSYTGYYFIMY